MSFGKQDNARCPFRGPVFRQPWGELTSDNLFSTFIGTLCSYPTNITALGLHEILGCPNVTIHPRPAQVRFQVKLRLEVGVRNRCLGRSSPR
jgi:hypothetical protein